jgi:hypothetical protein
VYKITTSCYNYSLWAEMEDGHEVTLATFDTEELAKAYEKASRLKNPKWNSKYRMKSLLGGHTKVYIEYFEPEIPPEHNPTL